MAYKSLPTFIMALVLLLLPANVIGSSYRTLLEEAETLAESGNDDSAQVIFRQALDSAEAQYKRSDSTIDLVFYEDGIPERVYFRGYQQAADLYSELLTRTEKIFGPDHFEVSVILSRLAEAKRVLAGYAEAETLAKRALVIREKTFGSTDARVAQSLNQLGGLYYYLGRYGEAAAFCDSSLMMRDSLLGSDHPAVAWSCLNLARAIIKLGYYEDAEALSRRAASILESKFGKESLEHADALEMVGLALYFVDKNAAAESLYVRVLDIRRHHLRPNHPEIATSLLRLANVYRYLNRYDESDSLCEEALRLRVDEFGRDHPDVAEIYHYWGVLHSLSTNDYAKAAPLLATALTIRENTLGDHHPATIDSRKRLARCYADQGRFAEAVPQFKTNRSILLELYGPEDSRSLDNLHRLAFNSMRLGTFDEAEVYHLEELRIKERLYGVDAQATAECLASLAMTYEGQGRVQRAADLLERAMSIVDTIKVDRDPDIFSLVNHNLAVIYYQLGRYEEAEELIARSIATVTEAFGPAHDNIAIGLLNLGLVYYEQGRYEQADSVYKLSVDLCEEVLGPQNPALAHALNNWANLCAHVGRYDEAESHQARAVSILEGALGPEHPEVAKFRRDQGRIYAYSGKVGLSRESYAKFIDWSQRFLENVFPYSSEEQKLRWIDAYPLMDHTVFSMALRNSDGPAKKLALEMLLKSKAMVIEAVMAEKQAAFCHYDDEILGMIDQLNEIHSSIAGLAMAGGYYRDSVETLYNLKDSFEVAISLHCSDFSDALAARRFEVSDVTNAVPRGSVLWEFMRYEPCNLDLSVVGDDKLGQARYLAFTVEHGGKVSVKDLGDATVIDSLITTARDMIYRAQGQIYSVAATVAEERLNEVTGQLYEVIFAPLAAISSGSTDIYVAPDGLLNLLPFESLPLGDGAYAIEKYRISYLSSGRDLLKHKELMSSAGEIFVLADADFDHVADTRTNLSDEFFGPEMRGNTACLTERFNPLPYSRNEAGSVVERFRQSGIDNVNERFGTQAGEEQLKELSVSPRVLHLATHGFFCEGDEGTTTMRDNPLLRSGLALAGANLTIAGERDDSTVTEDGILTALEVSGLNLVGTELAVLSACESGVGDLVNGEGVFGLRRAFQHAGVETVIMSLWSVPDRETSQLMDGFYKRWLEGMSKRDALRESALEVLNQSRGKRGCGHPLLWGGFILTGNPN